MTTHLNPAQTAQALPYPALAQHLQDLLRDPSVTVPARLVQPLAGGGSFFVSSAFNVCAGQKDDLCRPSLTVHKPM